MKPVSTNSKSDVFTLYTDETVLLRRCASDSKPLIDNNLSSSNVSENQSRSFGSYDEVKNQRNNLHKVPSLMSIIRNARSSEQSRIAANSSCLLKGSDTEIDEDDFALEAEDLAALDSLERQYSQLPNSTVTASAKDIEKTAKVNHVGGDLQSYCSATKASDATISEEPVNLALDKACNSLPDINSDFIDDWDDSCDGCTPDELCEFSSEYTVLEVHEDFIFHEGNHFRQLKLILEANDILHQLFLRGDWTETSIFVGDSIRVEATFDKDNTAIVDNDKGLIIIHPKILMSATAVASSFPCLRKAVISDRVGIYGPPTKAMVTGNILHDFFQHALYRGIDALENVDTNLETSIKTYISDIYFADLSLDEIREELDARLPLLKSIVEKYLISKKNDNNNESIHISRLLDIEESIWSPRFGLKGNIDATVEVVLTEKPESSSTLTLPLELKTGRYVDNISHFAQSLLYTLLISDRYGINTNQALLCYLENSTIKNLVASNSQLRGLIMTRNSLAQHNFRRSLPEMISNRKVCDRCSLVSECLFFQKISDKGVANSNGLTESWNEWMREVKDEDLEFYKKWEKLLNQEERLLLLKRGDVLTFDTEELEAYGKTLYPLYITKEDIVCLEIDDRVFHYKFAFLNDNGYPRNFLHSGFSVGERVFISDEHGHWSLAKGQIVHIQDSCIEVRTRHRLHIPWLKMPNFDFKKNQVFFGNYEDSKLSFIGSNHTRYRIDKDEFSSGIASIRGTLMSSVLPDAPLIIRDMIIRLKPPKFCNSALIDPEFLKCLNEDQITALKKCHAAEHYSLILGMPGTGKTTTISSLIRSLLAKKKKILLTSFTHLAVDNILIKLKGCDSTILRLGSPHKIHPLVKEFCLTEGTTFDDLASLKHFYEDPQIVACSSLGVYHSIFNKRKFDYCIIDEASQIPLPICLGPLQLAEKFVLVGDHYQLPPLVKNSRTSKDGLSLSLFKLLSEKHPEAVTTLRLQYRMNEDINSLSSELIYGGNLVCGSKTISQKKLILPKAHLSDGLPDSSSSLHWVNKLINPSHSVIFFNTDDILGVESKTNNILENHTEAFLIEQAVSSFLERGVKQSSIGIISIYKSQVELLSKNLKSFTEIEINTVDRYQGRDKDIILISFVRSNSKNLVSIEPIIYTTANHLFRLVNCYAIGIV